jgi:hypothetical protein
LLINAWTMYETFPTTPGSVRLDAR